MAENKGTDFPLGKILYLILYTVLLMTLGFYTFNVEGVFDIALPYLVLALIGMIVWLAGEVISQRKGIDFPDPIIVQKETLLGKLTPNLSAFVFFVFAMISAFVFLNTLTQTGFQVISAPLFQALPMTAELSAILTLTCAFVEELVIISIPLSIAYGLVGQATGNKYVGAVVGVFIATLVFTGYHTAKYGATMPLSMQQVAMFGLMDAAVLVVFQNIFYMSMVHSASNLGINFAKVYRIANPWPYFFVFLVIAGVVAFLIYKGVGRTKKERVG